MVAAYVNNGGKLDLLVAPAYPGTIYATVMLGDGTGKLTQGNTYGPMIRVATWPWGT